MPWTTGDVEEHKKGLSQDQKEQWVAIANQVLERCLEESGSNRQTCEAAAIRQANGVVGNMKRINFRVNAGDVRREMVNDREYLVAPVVAVKEGVLNYEDGTEFIPAEEIKQSVDWWNGVDLPIGHPKQRGQPISAKNKVVVDRNAVGRMWNAHYEDKKLKGELWIDIEKAKNMGGHAEEVINKLENDKPIDVSTAYVREVESASNGEYDRIQRNLRPDHLALLPHATGNQSWADGVGAPRINEDGDYVKTNVRSTARTPSYSGTSTGEWNAPSLGDLGFDSVADMSSADKTDIAEHSLLGEAGADTFNELLVLPVVSANGNLNKNALANAKARVNQVSGVSGDTVDSVKNRCTQLLEDEFDVEYEENAETIANKVFNKFKNYFRGEPDMPEELETIVENTNFEAEDLEDLSDKQLDEWASVYNEELEQIENDSEGDETDVKLEEKVENQAEEIEELKSKLKEQEKEERSEYVDTVTANSDFEEEELEDLDLGRLEKLAENVKPKANYAGRGMPRDTEDDAVASENMEEHLAV